MRKIFFVIVFIFTQWVCLNSLHAAFEPRPIGARAIALGQAFAAGQNEPSSLYWNPGALSTLNSKALEFSYQDVNGKGLVNFSNVSFAYPEIGPGTMGFSWSRLGVSNKVPFQYSENTYSIGYGSAFLGKYSLGGSINYYELRSEIKGSGYSANVGAQAWPVKNLVFGVSFANAARTTIRYDSGASDALDENLRVGLSFLLRESTRLYADVDQLTQKSVFHGGAEISLWQNSFDLRGGISQKTDKGDDLIFALGFGVNLRFIELNYAFENHFDLGGSHIATVKWKF